MQKGSSALDKAGKFLDVDSQMIGVTTDLRWHRWYTIQSISTRIRTIFSECLTYNVADYGYRPHPMQFSHPKGIPNDCTNGRKTFKES